MRASRARPVRRAARSRSPAASAAAASLASRTGGSQMLMTGGTTPARMFTAMPNSREGFAAMSAKDSAEFSSR